MRVCSYDTNTIPLIQAIDEGNGEREHTLKCCISAADMHAALAVTVHSRLQGWQA
jgi:hypothetical protein